MPFDPTKPVDDSQATAAELRNQFNALNDAQAALPTPTAVVESIRAHAANNVDGLAPIGLTISNPPTQAQVQALLNLVNSLITALHQPQV